MSTIPPISTKRYNHLLSQAVQKKKTTTYGVEVHVNKYVRHRRIVPMNERDSRGDDRMVVSFISTYAISVTNVVSSIMTMCTRYNLM